MQKRLQTFLALMLITAGCAGNPLERVRSVTYPPDFHYITSQEIQTTMGKLAVEVDALDRIMWQAGGPGIGDRDQVVATLSRMQSLASELKQRELSNHPRIHEHAPQLQQDIGRALNSARQEPPNYYYAGLASGACSYCHTPRNRMAPTP